jgi:hypothetical protein
MILNKFINFLSKLQQIVNLSGYNRINHFRETTNTFLYKIKIKQDPLCSFVKKKMKPEGQWAEPVSLTFHSALRKLKVTLPSVRNILVNTTINILQWVLTKPGTYLVLKRIWNPIDFQGQGHRVKFFTA